MSRRQPPDMSWRELFERADDREVSPEAVSAALEEHRDG